MLFFRSCRQYILKYLLRLCITMSRFHCLMVDFGKRPLALWACSDYVLRSQHQSCIILSKWTTDQCCCVAGRPTRFLHNHDFTVAVDCFSSKGCILIELWAGTSTAMTLVVTFHGQCHLIQIRHQKLSCLNFMKLGNIWVRICWKACCLPKRIGDGKNRDYKAILFLSYPLCRNQISFWQLLCWKGDYNHTWPKGKSKYAPEDLWSD